MRDMDNFLGDDGEQPSFKPPEPGEDAIDLLKPNSEQHKFVLKYLKKRIKDSEDAMSKFYPRWQIAERKMQAYLSLPDHEDQLRKMNANSQIPAPALILFPYNYAVIMTVVTYCMKVYCGRKPYFPLSADGIESANLVQYMEAMVQYQADQSKMFSRIYQLLIDGQTYGVAPMRCTWTTRHGKRTVIRPPTDAERMMFANNPTELPELVRTSEDRIIYAGNEFMNIDPFMFFPDPNVPMWEVGRKGEYVFWREFVGKHVLLKAQAMGQLKYVNSVEPGNQSEAESKWFNLSHRSIISAGDSHAGEGPRGVERLRKSSFQVDQGSVEIIPKELGLGPEEYPVKWLFTILNSKQIVQAEELAMNHGRHPVAVSEPATLGYGFGQPAMSDYISPIQDILSWFIDSHIFNVRAALQNQWLYDPSKIDEKSLMYPQPGKHIKLKPLAYGSDVRQALMQFPVTDVTRGHMQDIPQIQRLGDMVSAVNDPMRGVQSTGGRKTATEVRRTDESGGSRLGVLAQLISEQQLIELAEQSVLNIQQYQDADMWIRVIGEQMFSQVGNQLLMQDFTYNIHDGTLPLDRVASFDLWKEILMGMAQSPILSQTHSLPKIFEHVCTLGGAPNITSFRLVDDATMQAMAKAGNAVPIGPSAPTTGQQPPVAA